MHRLRNPQRHRVAFDELVNRRVDRLDQMIARSQPIRAGEKKAIRLRFGIVGMNDLGRNPARLPAQQVIAFNPKDRLVGIERPGSGAQGPGIDGAFAVRQAAVGRALRGPDLFGVKALAGFHQCRGHRLREIEPLALRHRYRP